MLASVSLAAQAHAQIELNDSNRSGVVLTVRPQSPVFVFQEGAAKSDDQKDSKSDAAADGQQSANKSADAQNGDNKTSDAGRLSPITMESVRAPIGAPNIAVTDIGTKVLPEDQASKQMVPRMPLPGGSDRALSG